MHPVHLVERLGVVGAGVEVLVARDRLVGGERVDGLLQDLADLVWSPVVTGSSMVADLKASPS